MEESTAISLAKTLLQMVSKPEPSMSMKDIEENNIRMWSLNPTDPEVKEMSSESIVNNIFQFKSDENPAAVVFYTVLALWRNCSRETESGVIRYLEKAGVAMSNYEGQDFVKLLSRVLDYPRRNIIDPGNPDFSSLSF